MLNFTVLNKQYWSRAKAHRWARKRRRKGKKKEKKRKKKRGKYAHLHSFRESIGVANDLSRLIVTFPPAVVEVDVIVTAKHNHEGIARMCHSTHETHNAQSIEDTDSETPHEFLPAVPVARHTAARLVRAPTDSANGTPTRRKYYTFTWRLYSILFCAFHPDTNGGIWRVYHLARITENEPKESKKTSFKAIPGVCHDDLWSTTIWKWT